MLVPGATGRPLTVKEFAAFAPEKLELSDGRVPGEEKLAMLLLTSLGLSRVASLVGHDAWKAAIEDQAFLPGATATQRPKRT